MRLRGLSLWSKSCGLKVQAAAHAEHEVKTVYVCDQDDKNLTQRDALIRSLRRNEGVGVLGLHCLATGKEDLRWAVGEIFKRGAVVYSYELEAEITDMPTIEAVLSATEIWADEARRIPRSMSVAYGEKGGRPRQKRMPKHDAQPIWRAAPSTAAALKELNKLAREKGFKKYSRITAYRDLGPRGVLRGRHTKSKET